MKFNQETLSTLNEHTGLVKLASGAITVPVAYIDLTLPTTYARFILEYSGIAFSASEFLAFAFDLGNGFPNDPINFDTYEMMISGINSGSPTAFYGANGSDALASTFATPDGEFALAGRVAIDPGSASFYPTLFIEDWAATSSPFILTTLQAFISFNLDATVSTSVARAQRLRLQPYGNGDTPPTSGDTIVSGSYTLWGIA